MKYTSANKHTFLTVLESKEKRLFDVIPMKNRFYFGKRELDAERRKKVQEASDEVRKYRYKDILKLFMDNPLHFSLYK